MNAQEIILLTKWVMAACPAQKFDRFTPDVWADLFEDTDPDEALAAAKSLARTNHFISPSDIIAEMKQIRIDQQRRSIAAKAHQVAIGVAEVPRAERLAMYQAARHDLDTVLGKDPKKESGRRSAYAEARTVKCTHCDAAAGQPCTNRINDTERSTPHHCRVDAALSVGSETA